MLRKVVPHETITCDDKDHLWMKKKVKELLKEKKVLCKNLLKKSMSVYLRSLQSYNSN